MPVAGGMLDVYLMLHLLHLLLLHMLHMLSLLSFLAVVKVYPHRNVEKLLGNNHPR